MTVALETLLGDGTVVPGRVVRGVVNANGSIASGTGFTVNRTGAGQYDVTFTVAFPATPVIIAMGTTDNLTFSGLCELRAASASAFTMHTRETSNNTLGDRVFHFIAMSV